MGFWKKKFIQDYSVIIRTYDFMVHQNIESMDRAERFLIADLEAVLRENEQEKDNKSEYMNEECPRCHDNLVSCGCLADMLDVIIKEMGE